MVKSLWTGASGMTAQQTSLDNIANNISNVNTAGYKKQTTEFASLLYQKLQREVTDHNGDPKPVIGQVGSGVRVSGLTSVFTQGSMLETGNDYDMCVDGNGFFRVMMGDGSLAYTRNGAFQLAIDEGGVTLATSEGYPVLDNTGAPISFDTSVYDVAQLELDEYGNFMYPDETGTMRLTGVQIGLAQFNNPAGLVKMSGSLFAESENSGPARFETEDPLLRKSKVISGYLEGSNVNVADEIVNLIVTQRAYEMNSKVINASDEMMQQANNLRS